MRKAGIKFTIGGTTFSNPVQAMESFTRPAGQIKNRLGELTSVYDEIAPQLINRIKHRFNSDFFGTSPMPPLGDKARKVRKARGINPDNPTLVGTGALRDSIKRRPGPTRSAEGGQREVYMLRIGSTGVPYAKDVFEGSIWELPVFFHPGGWFLIDYDHVEGAVQSTDQAYTKNTLDFMRREMTATVLQVPVPARDFLQMMPEDERLIMSKVETFLANMDLSEASSQFNSGF